MEADEGGDDSTTDDMSRNIVTDFDSEESGAINPSISSLDTQPPVKTSHMMDAAVLVPIEIGIAKPYAVL